MSGGVVQKDIWKGLVSTSFLGTLVFWVANLLGYGSIGILLAFLFGMVLGNLKLFPATLNQGIDFTASRFLESSLVFLAAGVNVSQLSRLGVGTVSVFLLVILAVVILTIWMAKRMQCPGSTGWLVGYGTAICGSSAIAALSPVVSKNKEDTAIALAVVNLLGSAAMLLLPFFLSFVKSDPISVAYLLGGTLHSVANVAGAAYGISDEVGQAAIAVKLARVALLSPTLIFFNYVVNRKSGVSWKSLIQLPWYLWAFVGTSVLVSLIPVPTLLLTGLEDVGKLVLTIAMLAIGIKVSIAKLLSTGKKGLVFGVLIFIIQVVLVAGAQWIMD